MKESGYLHTCGVESVITALRMTLNANVSALSSVHERFTKESEVDIPGVLANIYPSLNCTEAVYLFIILM